MEKLYICFMVNKNSYIDLRRRSGMEKNLYCEVYAAGR